MIGSLAANMYNGNTVLTACSITLANLVEATLAATIIRTRTGRRLLFQRSSDVVVLIAAARDRGGGGRHAERRVGQAARARAVHHDLREVGAGVTCLACWW